jgi:hypothetical protein
MAKETYFRRKNPAGFFFWGDRNCEIETRNCEIETESAVSISQFLSPAMTLYIQIASRSRVQGIHFPYRVVVSQNLGSSLNQGAQWDAMNLDNCHRNHDERLLKNNTFISTLYVRVNAQVSGALYTIF